MSADRLARLAQASHGESVKASGRIIPPETRDETALLTRPEVADRLRLSLPSVDKLVNGGDLVAVRFGRRVFFSKPAVEALIQARLAEATERHKATA